MQMEWHIPVAPCITKKLEKEPSANMYDYALWYFASQLMKCNDHSHTDNGKFQQTILK